METTSRPWFLLTAILLLLFVSKAHFTQLAADAISLEHPLSGNHTIISNGGNFELGFFSPGQSRNYYIGIWYKKIPKHTVVWVANRETPLPDTSSELKISEDGNIVLLNDSKIPIWSSNATFTASNRTIAILLDTGNLVLRDRSNSSSMFWQSFDYPTDTWLPEQKIGLNKVTGHRPRLISWRNSEDPAPGLYSEQIEADGTNQFFRMWNDSYRYYNSGVWDGHKHQFSKTPERPAALTDRLLRFTYNYVTNDKENYLVYHALDGYIIRFVMGISGQYNDWIWASDTQNWIIYVSDPPNICDVYAVCGPFGVCKADSSPACTCLQGFRPMSRRTWEMGDWSSGCRRENELRCARNDSGNGERVVFQRIPNMKLPINPKSLIAKEVGECEAQCLDDCTCTAYSYNASGCFTWNGDLLNLQQLFGSEVVGGDIYVRLLTDGNKDKKAELVLIIAGCGVGLVASLVIVSVLIWRFRRRLQVRELSSADSLVPFRYRDLRRATNNFVEKLGGGSFGSVFKGVLPDESVIAVKKLEGIGQGEKQFRSEVSTIGKIQHVNLVRLRGFCSEGSKRLLVYDFMPNGSLASHLFGFGQSCGVLSWKIRYQIALGIAKGLTYLHEECRESILHCDIKPENVLLDGAFYPKVADFGMAKLLGREFSRLLTTMRGTFGYLAPEWLQGVAITKKADVYSYGMMVLEIISGCRNSHQGEMSGADYFPILAATKIREDGDVLGLLDPRLEGNADIEELNRLCRVACWCIQENEESRPSMVQIVLILEGVLEVSVPPIPRFLQILFPIGDTIISSIAEK